MGRGEGGLVNGEAQVVSVFDEGFGADDDLSQFSWMKCVCIQILISVRQLVSVE